MTTVYYVLSALSVLFIAFPRRKVTIISAIIPVFFVVIVSFTMIKQFSYDVTSTGDSGISQKEIVKTISAYVSTTQNIAKAYDMYRLHGDQMSVNSVTADIVGGVVFLQLPIFNRITTPIFKYPTSIALASTGTEVVPMSGQALFYGGYVFGWLFDILFFIIIIRLLVITDCFSKMEKRIGNKYLYTWISITFGMIMTYNFSIIWTSVNYIPFFTLCALIINRRIRINKSHVVY